MLSMKALMRFLDRGFLLRALYLVMLYSLVPFGECVLLLIVEDYVGGYIILAIVAATAILGLLLVIRPLTHTLEAVHASIDDGAYPAEPFALLAGTLVSAVLLLTPGLVTDVLGLICLIRFVRRAVGRGITHRMSDRLNELYEYIKLYER